MSLTVQQLQDAAELKRRLEVRRSYKRWCCEVLDQGLIPDAKDNKMALHQEFIVDTLNKLVTEQLTLPDGRVARRLILMCPPGAAKSTYTSWLFPPWFLNLRKGLCILACSYAYELAEKWGGQARDLIDKLGPLLGYKLDQTNKASGRWKTTNLGEFFCAGCNAGIAGRRADLGLIDDPIGTEQDAQSELYRNHNWKWYRNDFVPRLKPNAFRVIICNRRHEDDLVGRLLNPKQEANECGDWLVLSLPMEAEENDILGRQKGERLWPEWFTEEMVRDAKKDEKTWSGLYQQHPTPESGDFFKRDWILGYHSPSDLPRNLRIYEVSDHTTSKARGANKTCYLPFGVDEDNHIWILPEIYWEKCKPLEAVEAMFAQVQKHKPLRWRAEKGHISDSLEPLINKLMREKGIFFVLEQVVPKRSKGDRCRSIAGRMQQKMVHFPTFASWYSSALFEMMSFTGSGDDKSDDFCDCLGHIGGMLDEVISATPTKTEQPQPLDTPFIPTMGWMRQQEHAAASRDKCAFNDN